MAAIIACPHFTNKAEQPRSRRRVPATTAISGGRKVPSARGRRCGARSYFLPSPLHPLDVRDMAAALSRDWTGTRTRCSVQQWKCVRQWQQMGVGVAGQGSARNGAARRGGQVPRGFFAHMRIGGVTPAQPLHLARKRAHRKLAHSRQGRIHGRGANSGTPNTHSKRRARLEQVNILPNAGGVVRRVTQRQASRVGIAASAVQQVRPRTGGNLPNSRTRTNRSILQRRSIEPWQDIHLRAARDNHCRGRGP